MTTFCKLFIYLLQLQLFVAFQIEMSASTWDPLEHMKCLFVPSSNLEIMAGWKYDDSIQSKVGQILCIVYEVQFTEKSSLWLLY